LLEPVEGSVPPPPRFNPGKTLFRDLKSESGEDLYEFIESSPRDTDLITVTVCLIYNLKANKVGLL